MATVAELKELIKDLPDSTELAGFGHSGNMLYPEPLPEVFTVTEEFASANPEHNWCAYKAGTTVLVLGACD